MKKVRVALYGNLNKVAILDADATEGATLGTDLKYADGRVVTLANLATALGVIAAGVGGVVGGGGSSNVVIWRTIQEIPPNVIEVGELTTSGLVVRQADGNWLTRSLAVADASRLTVVNPAGEAGNPTLDLALVADSGAGSLLAITRDGYGRVSGTRAPQLGDIPDGVLSSNVALLNRTPQTFTGANTFTGVVTFNQAIVLPDGSIPFADLANGAACSVLGRAANTAGVHASIAAAANDTFLRRTGDTLNFGQLTAAMFPAGVIPPAALPPNIAFTNVANTFTVSPQTISSAANTELAMVATTGGVDETRWSFIIVPAGDTFGLYAINDARSAFTNAMLFTRVGATVSAIALAATAITLNGVNVTDYARKSQNNVFAVQQDIVNAASARLRLASGTTELYLADDANTGYLQFTGDPFRVFIGPANATAASFGAAGNLLGGTLRLTSYGAGTLTTDASGNVTATAGGGLPANVALKDTPNAFTAQPNTFRFADLVYGFKVGGATAFLRTGYNGVEVILGAMNNAESAAAPLGITGSTITLNGVNITDYARLSQNNLFAGQNRFSGGAAQTVAPIVARNTVGANCFEWGHNNPAGYANTLGFQAGDGKGFVAFHAEAGTNPNTYRTRGIPGFVIRSNAAGGIEFNRVVTATADNQVPATADFAISAAGFVTIQGVSFADFARLSVGNTFTGSSNVFGATGTTGYLNLNAGGATQAGYMGFYTADAVRRGYIGWAAGTSLVLVAETGWTWTLDGIPTSDIARKSLANTFTARNVFLENVQRFADPAGTASAMLTYLSFQDATLTERGWIGYGIGTTQMRVTNTIGELMLLGTPITLNGVSTADFARLSVANLFTAQNTFATNATTVVTFESSHATGGFNRYSRAGVGTFMFIGNGQAVAGRALDTGMIYANTALYLHGAGGTVYLNDIPHTDFARLSQPNVFTSSGSGSSAGLELRAALPLFMQYATGSAVDAKRWSSHVAGSSLFIGHPRNDAGTTSGTAAIVIARTLNVIDLITLTTVVTNITAPSGTGQLVMGTSSASSGLLINGGAGPAAIWNRAPGHIIFGTNATARLTLGAAGEFTIANVYDAVFSAGLKVGGHNVVAAGTGPGCEVIYSGGQSYVQAYDRTAAAYIALMLVGSNVDVNAAVGNSRLLALGSLRLTARTDGYIQFNAYGAGTLTTDAAGVISPSSDERIKRNIRPFRTGLAAIRALRPILHGYAPDSGLDQEKDTYVGFSAQNVQTVLPEAVGAMKSGMLTLSDRAILAALVNAVKELSA